MRRIARLDRSIDLLRPRVSTQASRPYLCSACKYQSTSFSTSTLRAERDRVPITEKVRRKIWGTENPPGQADPYGDASVFDRTKEREKRLDEEEAAEEEAAAKRARRPIAPEESLPDSSYEPAMSWEGLEVVGEQTKADREVWDNEHQFHAFLPKYPTKSNEQISVAVHRAIVETLALKKAEIPFERMFKGNVDKDLTRKVQVVLSTDGSATLKFPKYISLDKLVQAIITPPEKPVETEVVEESEELGEEPALLDETSVKENPTEAEEDVAADRSSEDPLTAAQQEIRAKQSRPRSDGAVALVSWNPAWLQVSLKDPAFKFAVLKRTLHLTGIHFPDAAITHTNDVQTLLSHLAKKPKPTKLNQDLQVKKELKNLSNVHVYNRRITSVDKEVAVGRWKIIEQELIERGLPVTGHGNEVKSNLHGARKWKSNA